MQLFLDNTGPEELVIFVSGDGGSWREYRRAADGEGNILKTLEEILKSEKIKLADLSGIAVRVGVGRFTATRLAVVFGNTLSYALQIPISAVHDSDPKLAFEKLQSAPAGKYIAAEYSAEPRLGGQR